MNNLHNLTKNTREFDSTQCQLGEGPLWHPNRNAFFWFDILQKTLYSKEVSNPTATHWKFDHYVSAAHWVDEDHLLIASEIELFIFNIKTSARKHLIDLEATQSSTRSNDGRGDAHGGFWIGTMDVDAKPGAGSIYRFYCGELRRLHKDITIPNGICFAPDGSSAYFADSASKKMYSQTLNRHGWPSAPPELFIDFQSENRTPDGATTDSDGNLWIAEWGGSLVSCFSPMGNALGAVPLPCEQPTCPVFGGALLNQLMVTSATVGLPENKVMSGYDGATYIIETVPTGWTTPAIKMK